MFINLISHYLPEKVITNDYLSSVNGMKPEEIRKKAGMLQRRRAGRDENVNSMCRKAVENGLDNLPFPLPETELIIGASYTPYDLIGTMAHDIQRHYNIQGAKALFVSTACSSFVNAVEIALGYKAMGKASKALILTAEHNSAYSNDLDTQSGHLWGDGAAAIYLSDKKTGEKSLKIIDVLTEGIAQTGLGPDAIYMRPLDGNLQMPHGRDVFVHAIDFMTLYLHKIVHNNGFSMPDIKWVVPHQANARIISQIARNLDFPEERILMNIKNYGNTGCASTPILLSENWDRLHFGDLIALAVFGGGYSAGAMLLRVV